MDLLQHFREHVKQQGLFSPKDRLLLAVSGGVDSVVLCELCKQAGYDFLIAHCNFQLRGEESARDEEFVKALGEKYKVEVKIMRFDTEQYAAENKLSIQEAARKLRYGWFEEIVVSHESGVQSQESKVQSQESGVNTVSTESIHHSPFTIHLLTAHHADDNAETLLMNFFRGTGLHGLTGIPEKSGYIRRPLLPFTKEELLAFAKEHQLEFVEDSSNLSSKYTRNFFRNELIPAIGKVYPQVKGNLQDNIDRFREIEKLYRLSVNGIIQKLSRTRGKEIHIPVKQLMGYRNRALIYELISPYGFAEKQVEELVKLAASDSGKYISSPDGAYRIIKHRHWFIISPVAADGSGHFIIEKNVDEVPYATGRILIRTVPIARCELPVVPSRACLDSKDIVFPLLLRKWKTGDYFYPLGMKKKKKIARFLIDSKLSKTEKENVWVLESAQRIIWVLGHRIDERFRITEKTKEVLQLELL